MITGELLRHDLVWKSYAHSRLKEGRLPLASPRAFGGVAVHADPRVGVFYPPNYLFLALPGNAELMRRALEVFQLLHLVLAGVGMWLLLRHVGTARGPAWTGALVAMTTGFMADLDRGALVASAAWIPLNLYLARRAVESTGARPIALAAVGLALMLLAGPPQPALFGGVLAALWILFDDGWKRLLCRLGPTLTLASALALVQILPTAALDGASIERPAELGNLYVGLGSLLLAAVGLAGSRSRTRWFFAAVAAGSLLVGVAAESLWSETGVVGGLRAPFGLAGLFCIATAVLAGLGMESLLSMTPTLRRRVAIVLKGAFGVLVVLAAGSATLHTRLLVSPGPFDASQAERLVAGVNWMVLLAALNVGLLVTFLLWRAGRRWTLVALAALLVVDLGSFATDRGQVPYERVADVGVASLDKLLRSPARGAGRFSTGPDMDSAVILSGADVAGGPYRTADDGYARLLRLGRESANALALLNVKFVASAGARSEPVWCGPRFPSPLPLLDITPEMSPLTLELSPAIEVGYLQVFWTPLPGKATSGGVEIEVDSLTFTLPEKGPLGVGFPGPTALRRFTVRLDAGSPGIRLHGLELDGSPLGLKADFLDLGGLRMNLHCLPRAYFVEKSSLGAPEATDEALRCWTPLEPVLVSHPETGATWSGYFRNGLVDVARYEPETVELDLDSPRAGYVVLADTYRPGWHAEVDGGEAPLLLAQGAFRAVEAPAGRHRIRFFYRPGSLIIGAVISLLATLVVLVVLAGRGGFLGTSKPGNTGKESQDDSVEPVGIIQEHGVPGAAHDGS